MGLSCSCEDFDKSEFDWWYEPGGAAAAPAWCTCCECDAPIAEGEQVQTIDHWEVYEPDEALPPDPDDSDEDLSDDDYRRISKARDEACDRLGWDDDCERFERLERVDYRCERCSDLAETIEALGYCMVPPGELIGQHCEYVEQSGGHEVIWKRDAAGVLQPHRMTRLDFAIREAGVLRRRALYFMRYGWQGTLRYRVWFPLQAAVMTRLGYHYRYLHAPHVYGWVRD